jgi:glycosyltransferase involved in cell wall biosynthesis
MVLIWRGLWSWGGSDPTPSRLRASTCILAGRGLHRINWVQRFCVDARPQYGTDIAVEGERLGLRSIAVRQTHLYVPFSRWAAEQTLVQHPEIVPSTVVPIHPGIDLSRWRVRAKAPSRERMHLLFVGGDIMRRGGDVLVEAYERHLQNNCQLQIATQAAHLPDNLGRRILDLSYAHLYLDFSPNSHESKDLYAQCDVFVLPTAVTLEAEATTTTAACPACGIISQQIHDRYDRHPQDLPWRGCPVRASVG